LSTEVREASPQLRGYLGAQLGLLPQNDHFVEALPGHLQGDAASQSRMPELIRRLRTLVQ
jgi:hypothetical protein